MLESVKIPNFYRVTLLYCSSCCCGDIGYSCITWVVAATVDFVKRIRVRCLVCSPPALLATCRASVMHQCTRSSKDVLPADPVFVYFLFWNYSVHSPLKTQAIQATPHRARGSPAKYSTARPTTATYRSHPPPPGRHPLTYLEIYPHSHYVITLT